MLEVAHLVPFAELAVARNPVATAILQVEGVVQETELNTRDENSCNRNQHNRLLLSRYLQLDQGALILAKELFDPFEGDRIHGPSIARDVPDGSAP